MSAVAGAAALRPLAARAQEAGRTYRLGFLHQSPGDAPHDIALFDELRRAGFIEGQNLTIDWPGTGLPIERFADHAMELVQAHVDVILCGGDVAARAGQRATATIPIIALVDDMVGQRLVSSLAKPGGNLTGVSIFATELDGKRQEVLIEAIQGLRRMEALADTGTTLPSQLQALRDAAHARGVELSVRQVSRRDEIAPAIDEAKNSGAEALNVLASPLLFANRQLIIERTASRRLPAIYQWPTIAEQGGLIGYGPRIESIYRELVSRQVVAVLRGARPSDLPVMQPTRFELVVNLKTARAIGLAVPQSLLARADEVIE
jgi:putative ABC transport system substrate-binding protein